MRFQNHKLSNAEKYECVGDFERAVRKWLHKQLGINTPFEIEPTELDRIASVVAQKFSDELLAY